MEDYNNSSNHQMNENSSPGGGGGGGTVRGSFLYASPVLGGGGGPNNNNNNNSSSSTSPYGRASSGSSSLTPFHLLNSPNFQSDHHQTVKTESPASAAAAGRGTSSHHHHKFHHYSLLRDQEHQYPQQQQQQANNNNNNNSNENSSSSGGGGEVEALKAKIVSHPHYSNLLEAYMDCQKVGAPPEVVARLAAARQEFESRQRSSGRDSTNLASNKDPELDQFMEAYYDMLVKYREELTRPIQEAMEFMRRIETQLNMMCNVPLRVFNSEEKSEGVGSSEEDPDNSGGETELPEIDPRAEDRELKNHLLRKYSGYLSSLKQELSKKKKKGKLPKEARQKLLSWWELHYKWPYPSESEKLALAESTGLDQKQINNWFINQRKRHWKPSEDMQFMVMDGLHPHQNAALYMGDGHYMGDGPYRLGP